MSYLIDVSATTDKLNSHLDMLACFLNSASTLFAAACDGVEENKKNSLGKPSDEFWNQHYITAFFLSRHALELAIKALVKEISGHDVKGHNIKTIWEENIPDYQNVLPEEITRAFTVLAKYKLLEDAQLFRYHADKGGTKLKSLPPITNEDFDALSNAAWAVRDTILGCIHRKKGLPL